MRINYFEIFNTNVCAKSSKTNAKESKECKMLRRKFVLRLGTKGRKESNALHGITYTQVENNNIKTTCKKGDIIKHKTTY